MRSAGIKGSEVGRMKILGFGREAGGGAAPGASASVLPWRPLSAFLVILLFLVVPRVDLRVAGVVRGAIAVVKFPPPRQL